MNTRIIALSTAACAALIGFSGCVFGNREIDPPGPGSIQGNYEVQIPQFISVCVKKPVTIDGTTQDQTICEPLATADLNSNSWAYEMFTIAMSEPVFLGYDPTNGYFTISKAGDPNPDFSWTVVSDNQGDLGTPGMVGYQPFSHLMPDTHPNCDWNFEYQASGTYGPPSTPFPAGSSLSGKITMNYSAIFSPTGDCSQLEACYNSATGCDTLDNEIVQAEFSAPIQAHAMTATDIPTIESIEYDVSYQ